MSVPDRQIFNQVCARLRTARGASAGVTIDSMADAFDVPRRTIEACVEVYLEEFPFPIVSGSSGLFIPATAEEINHYRASLQSRINAISRRRDICALKCAIAGFPQEQGRFVDAPRQRELFS